MADWNIVRNDPTYEEKLDPEIIPLCDALNAAGFETIASCCGHGQDWPRVWFLHLNDAAVEVMARFVMKSEEGDFRPYFSVFQKEILPKGFRWTIEIHLNNAYASTPTDIFLRDAVAAIGAVAKRIDAWRDKAVALDGNEGLK